MPLAAEFIYFNSQNDSWFIAAVVVVYDFLKSRQDYL